MKMNSTFKVLAMVLMVAIVCFFLNDSISDKFLHASLAEDDSWFTRRFDKSVEPFLTGKQNLSMEAFDWWKQLQPLEEQTIEYYRAVADSLLKTFPAMSKGAERFGTCAVVGNSANLKDSHYGRLIDIHDVVLRMNKSPIKGYEDDVGSKTSHRLMYPESATDLDNVTHLVLSPFKIMDMVWLQKALTTGFPGNTYEPVRSTIQANKNLVMVLNPAFIAYVHRMWLRRSARYPSTGFLAVILALHICEEVRVFGYGADSDGNWSHYWEKLRDPKLGTGLHYGKEEYDVIRKLAVQQKIHFFKMSSPKF
ncbi:CMP-N-acetylneuraminate-beta-galactosamide-alpha-2,3-sialyltransferase 1-like [Hippocampus zosterae]|uniref:CMP-N-acetylneuraminate-beta-galactosamide- alpha-2,3-sialyltransferase 1-like n=1 Tax=Hippocampus zosterae TaxID=109293 RepID=UPI00223DD66D|nr:CMP-N-acetylneuraminate-beta-galactosamide-alpha-2,3-sialyltransferase 1-like [Hippocampus zosterae]XP_051927834.1 CMP-N-acetylneuraminate-beta-galactosamide-alpha-2,3-sialyltransferase 1-like [Hippocampus zosterae]